MRRGAMAILGLALAGALVGATAGVSRGDGAGRRMVTLPLDVHVLLGGGRPVRGRGWIDAQVREANRLLAPAAVRTRVTSSRPLCELPGTVADPIARDMLGRWATPGAIHAFVTHAVLSVDGTGFPIDGVCWRGRGTDRRYLIVSAYGHSDVLAHELGHFLGLGHERDASNLMSYGRTEGAASLTSAQLSRVRAAAIDFVLRREPAG